MTGWQGSPQEQDPYYAHADPYVGHQTGDFPIQGYPPPPPPPGRSNLPMIFGVLSIVLIVAAVVTIVLVNRGSAGTPTAATTPPPAPTSPSGDQTGPTTTDPTEPSTSDKPDSRDGWQNVDNTADAGLVYAVPPAWALTSADRSSGLNVDFTGTADYGIYECEGKTYIRAFATSGDVQGKGGTDLDLAKTVRDFTGSFARTYFKDTAEVTLAEPTETEVDDRPAMTLVAKVSPRTTAPACEATEGQVAVVGVLLKEEGKPAGVAMLVVVTDVAGGPADPEPLPRTVTEEILASVSVG